MKKTNTFAAFIAAAMLTVPVLAEEERRGFYIAPEIGRITINGHCDEVAGVTITSCEDSELGFGISAGYLFNDYIGVEGGARFASGFDASGSIGGQTFSGESEFKNLSIGTRIKLPLRDNFALTGKVGFHFWEQEIESEGVSDTSIDDTDPYFGAGVEFSFNEKMSFRAEWTRFFAQTKIGAIESNEEADIISGSLVINF